MDAEWIVAKKDWQEAKKKQKARGMSYDGAPVDNGNTQQDLPPQYQPEMDEMRCVLYAHGGRLRCIVVLLHVLIVNRRLLLW